MQPWLMTTVTAVEAPSQAPIIQHLQAGNGCAPEPLPDRASALLLRRTQTPLGSGLSLSHLPPRALAMRACSPLKDTIFALEKNRRLICPQKGNRNWKSCLKPKLQAPGSHRRVCYLCLSPKPSDRASVPAAIRKTISRPFCASNLCLQGQRRPPLCRADLERSKNVTSFLDG